jgi:hypothetical protein
MRRFTAIVSIVLALLLVFASAAGTQAAPKVPRVAMLCAPACRGSNMDALYDELRKLGWIEDSTIVIERKEAASHLDELAGVAADLVRSKPDLIVTVSPQPARAVKEATSEIPIVRRRSGRNRTCIEPCSSGRKLNRGRHAGPGRFHREATRHSSRALASSEARGGFHQSCKRHLVGAASSLLPPVLFCWRSQFRCAVQ